MNHFKFTRNCLSALCLGGFALSAQANIACNVGDFQITTMTNSATGASVPLPGFVSASSCYGVVDGNNAQNGLQEPNPNLGYLGDGFMNGQGGLISPTQFISSTQLLDLKTPGSYVDPGWIHLGTVAQGTQIMAADSVTVAGTEFDLSKVLSFNLNSNGTWSLTTTADIISQLTNAGFSQRTSFDHLAIAVKQADHQVKQEAGGWAVYDFNFGALLAAAPDLYSVSQPYSFTGTWNMTEFIGNGYDFSHVDVWARDPITASSVPEPAGLALLGIGLAGLGMSRRKKD